MELLPSDIDADGPLIDECRAPTADLQPGDLVWNGTGVNEYGGCNNTARSPVTPATPARRPPKHREIEGIGKSAILDRNLRSDADSGRRGPHLCGDCGHKEPNSYADRIPRGKCRRRTR